MAGEPHSLIRPSLVDGKLHGQFVAAERIQVVELEVRPLDRIGRRTPVVRMLVVVEDVLAVELVVHRE